MKKILAIFILIILVSGNSWGSGMNTGSSSTSIDDSSSSSGTETWSITKLIASFLRQSSGLASALPGTCTPPSTYYATDTETHYLCSGTTWYGYYKVSSDGAYGSGVKRNTSAMACPSGQDCIGSIGGNPYFNTDGTAGASAKRMILSSDVIKLAVFNFPGDAADNTVIDSYQPFAATITGWVITNSGAACSAVVDIWAQAYADFPPENAQSIAASALPTLSTAQMNKDTTLTGWTKAIAADSFLRANLDSSDCTGTIQVTIYGTR